MGFSEPAANICLSQLPFFTVLLYINHAPSSVFDPQSLANVTFSACSIAVILCMEQLDLLLCYFSTNSLLYTLSLSSLLCSSNSLIRIIPPGLSSASIAWYAFCYLASHCLYSDSSVDSSTYIYLYI